MLSPSLLRLIVTLHADHRNSGQRLKDFTRGIATEESADALTDGHVVKLALNQQSPSLSCNDGVQISVYFRSAVLASAFQTCAEELLRHPHIYRLKFDALLESPCFARNRP